MATPFALFRGGGDAAKRGIPLRIGDAFQIVREVDTIVLEKTGTITNGEPAVAEIVALGDRSEMAVLRTAASAETFSEHPLADAILDHAREQEGYFADPDAFDSEPGKGVRATVDSEPVLVGKTGWLRDQDVEFSEAIEQFEGSAERPSALARECFVEYRSSGVDRSLELDQCRPDVTVRIEPVSRRARAFDLVQDFEPDQ